MKKDEEKNPLEAAFGAFPEFPDSVLVSPEAQDLEPTGACHWCGEECGVPFCSSGCWKSYQDGVVQEGRPNSAPTASSNKVPTGSKEEAWDRSPRRAALDAKVDEIMARGIESLAEVVHGDVRRSGSAEQREGR